MGDLRVRLAERQDDINLFTKYLLRDVQALSRMLEEDWFETEQICIGAEQELCLVDDHGKPSSSNLEVLEKMNHPAFTTELAKFNIEANLDPLPFTGNCFSDMENNLSGLLADMRRIGDEMGVYSVMTGILPTIRRFDLNLKNLTPLERYYSLIEAVNNMRGGSYELRLEGHDELNVMMESALIEACNTSFQVHLQIRPDDFVRRYNIAQAVAAPVMAVSTNSPMLFGKRLWSETRIALFRQSIDTRFTGDHLRERAPRVMFGSQWLKDSILKLYQEDIARFRVMFTTDVDEDVFECIENGITPKLRALNIHNSTVYRWNRPCYGISPSGKPHLRIENRIFPAGPSIVDEIANMAFWVGLMNGCDDEYKNITEEMDFLDAKSNFLQAAQHGLGTRFIWRNERKIHDTELIKKELLPLARQGLQNAQINPEDIDKYLGIIEERNETGYTGSRWILNSYSKLTKTSSLEEVTLALTSSIVKNQRSNLPVHQWKVASLNDIEHFEPSALLVEEFMTRDIFTVTKDDIAEFSADIMDWKKVNYIPVENQEGELIGLITIRTLLHYFLTKYRNRQKHDLDIEHIMVKNLQTVAPHDTVEQAMEVMETNMIGCLPVVHNRRLVGILTESNFLNVSSSLMKHWARQRRKEQIAKEQAQDMLISDEINSTDY